jgi:hypothetical protein
LLLVRGQLRGAAKLSAAIPRGRQAGPSPFTDHRPFEFSKTAKHLHNHPAQRFNLGGGVLYIVVIALVILWILSQVH